jgi:hypothetical protein
VRGRIGVGSVVRGKAGVGSERGKAGVGSDRGKAGVGFVRRGKAEVG